MWQQCLQGPSEVNGDRDRIARKTLDFHSIHTPLLFKLFAGNILLCNNTFFRSRNQVFIVKHYHRQVVRNHGTAPTRLWKSSIWPTETCPGLPPHLPHLLCGTCHQRPCTSQGRRDWWCKPSCILDCSCIVTSLVPCYMRDSDNYNHVGEYHIQLYKPGLHRDTCKMTQEATSLQMVSA